MTLAIEKELENITIYEIEEKANVNRGTIYLHFIDTYDLRQVFGLLLNAIKKYIYPSP
jgi:AcrR family transcriptional regulator